MTESERLVVELRASNAELLAALTDVYADYEAAPEKDDFDWRRWGERARAAIAKAVPAPKAKPTIVYHHAPARPWIVTPRMRKTR